MTELLEGVWIYISELGIEHNVDPIIFGILYVGSIPPYLASMAWIEIIETSGLSLFR